MTARPRAVIIGMMGAGKTRVGKEVAHMLRLPFADADVEIEREVHEDSLLHRGIR